MSWVNILFAMAPENILLAGIIVLIGLEVAEADERSALAVSLIALVSACFVATWLAMNGYAFDAFPGHYSVDGSTLLAKAIVLALAVPVVLVSRDETDQRQFHILLAASLYGICLLLSADSFITLFLGSS